MDTHKQELTYFNLLAVISVVASLTVKLESFPPAPSPPTPVTLQMKCCTHTNHWRCCRRWCSHRQVPNSTGCWTGARNDVVKTGIQAGAGSSIQKAVNVRTSRFVCFAQAADRCTQSQSFRETDVQLHRRPLQVWHHPIYRLWACWIW